MTVSDAPGRHHGATRAPISANGDQASAYDPLKLCIFATIAALGWLLGPVALLGFATLGLVGYARAWRQGLTRSKCLLRDTRVVLGYLALLAAIACVGIYLKLL